ncbi:MAG TPA: ABC transporter ATP-binding protein [Candidatus Dormibacteraeota bacterium]
MAPAIEVRDLVKRYRKGKVNAVDGISFEVEPGEFFALLGPNGAGKTTTISILTTTLAPTSGRVLIAGHDIVREASTVRRHVGIIFQNPSLDMNLTGEENVRFHAVLYGLYPYRPLYRLMPSAYRQQVRELAEMVALGADVFKPVRRLSGGMQRKLEIIRGLMHHPRILFLDEPTRGLDVASRRTLWQYIEELRRQHELTICLTTHQLDEAEDADRVCILDHGHVVAIGSPRDVKAQLVHERLIIDAADRDALRRRLRQMHLSFTEDRHFDVSLDRLTAYEVVHGIGQPLTMLRTESASLEDAYLRILASSDA